MGDYPLPLTLLAASYYGLTLLDAVIYRNLSREQGNFRTEQLFGAFDRPIVRSYQISASFTSGQGIINLGSDHMKDDKKSSTPMRFNSVLQADVPKGRDGKHKEIVTQLLSDIHQLADGSALKIPLAELPDTKENIRSALSRAASQRNLRIATSSNDEFLYVWKTD
jgi:hypothetical protein